jgi:hypothetical protein
VARIGRSDDNFRHIPFRRHAAGNGDEQYPAFCRARDAATPVASNSSRSKGSNRSSRFDFFLAGRNSLAGEIRLIK